MGACKLWGEVGRWLVIALIQIFKYAFLSRPSCSFLYNLMRISHLYVITSHGVEAVMTLC